jgi:putative acyl-CoA dehydrogenase
LLRAIGKDPDVARAALAAELAPAMAIDRDLKVYAKMLLADLDPAATCEYGARDLAQRLVTAVQGALLVRYAPAATSSAFVASRIVRRAGGAFGHLDAGADCAAILARALPG